MTTMNRLQRIQFRNRILSVVFLSILSLSANIFAADNETGFLNRVYHDDAGEHKYVVFVPQNYTPEQQWPVILFLHGAGERGTDGLRQTMVGLGPAVKLRQKTFPFLVVFPQCEDIGSRALNGWQAGSPNGKRARQILNAVEKDYNVDAKHRILTGWSMGGYGTWSIAKATPKHWSSVVPIAGGGEPKSLSGLSKVPIWAFHGVHDRAVLSRESRRMVNALKKTGGNPRYTEIPKIGHDVWKDVYDNDLLYEWMRNPTQSGAPAVTAFQKKQDRLQELEGEFIPAVEISRAISVRIGNQALKAASYSIPSAVPKDAFSGRIENMSDTTVTEGRTFNVFFSRISYKANLSRAYVQVLKKDRVTIQFGLSDTTLTIGRTNVVGNRRSAVAGPMQIVLGHRRPIWLNLDVIPSVVNRKVKLKLVGHNFEIPDDNWYVSGPSGISTNGLGMTAERVSNGLVSGLYGSKSLIEEKILEITPSIVKQIEEKLQIDGVSKLAKSFWPLPVYQPRLRIWPEEIAIDQDGISLSLGLTAAALDPQKAPSQPKHVGPLGPPLETFPRSSYLQVGLAPNVLTPLTELMIEEELARIHVLDIPDNIFAAFADKSALQAAIPDLKSFPETLRIRSELILKSPLSVQGQTLNNENAPSTETPSQKMTFLLPRITIAISIRQESSNEKWTPYAEFDFELAHSAVVKKTVPNFETRGIRIDWAKKMDLKTSGRFVTGYQPRKPEMDLNRIQSLFTQSWNAWTAGGPVAEAVVPDIDLGFSKLRLSHISWSAQHLLAQFTEPGVKLTNNSKISLIYETKGPYSDWGGPYTLAPNDYHEFEISYPLLFRRKTGNDYKMFTLPVGTHSEFRSPVSGGPPQLFQSKKQTNTLKTSKRTAPP